jgi:hypothetical protein
VQHLGRQCMVYGVSECECMYECSTLVGSVWCMVCQSVSACMSAVYLGRQCMVYGVSECECMYECSTLVGSV